MQGKQMRHSWESEPHGPRRGLENLTTHDTVYTCARFSLHLECPATALVGVMHKLKLVKTRVAFLDPAPQPLQLHPAHLFKSHDLAAYVVG